MLFDEILIFNFKKYSAKIILKIIKYEILSNIQLVITLKNQMKTSLIYSNKILSKNCNYELDNKIMKLIMSLKTILATKSNIYI